MSSICEILFKNNKELKECESLKSMDKYFEDFVNDSEEYFNIFNFISLSLSNNENIDFDKLIISLDYYLKKYSELKYVPNNDFYIQIINNILTTVNKKIVENDFYKNEKNFYYFNLFIDRIKNILQIKIDKNDQIKIEKDINIIFKCFQEKSNLNNINKDIINNILNNFNNNNFLNISNIKSDNSSYDESFSNDSKNILNILKRKEFLIKNIEDNLEKNNKNINYNIDFISNKNRNNNYNNFYNKLNKSNKLNKNSMEKSSNEKKFYENLDNIENDIIHEDINNINCNLDLNCNQIEINNSNNFNSDYKKSQNLKKSIKKKNNLLKTISTSYYYKNSQIRVNIKDIEQNFKDNKYYLKCVGSFSLNTIKLTNSCIDLIFLPVDNKYKFISKTDIKNWINEKNKNNLDILIEDIENDKKKNDENEDKKNFLFYYLYNKERKERKRNVTIYIQRDKYLFSNQIIQNIFNDEPLNVLYSFYYRFFLYFGLFNGFEVNLIIITFLDLKYNIFDNSKKQENLFHKPNYHNNKLISEKIFNYDYNENNLNKFRSIKKIEKIIDNFTDFMITFIDKYEEIKEKYSYLIEKKYLFNIQFFFEQIRENIKKNKITKNKIFKTIKNFIINNNDEDLDLDYDILYEDLINNNILIINKFYYFDNIIIYYL